MSNFRNTTTGEIVPGHNIGTDEQGRKIYAYAENFVPTFNFDMDADGNYIDIGELLTEDQKPANPPAKYRIESFDGFQWDAEYVGDSNGNIFDTEEEAEAEIENLKKLGDEWADAEYRVTEIK